MLLLSSKCCTWHISKNEIDHSETIFSLGEKTISLIGCVTALQVVLAAVHSSSPPCLKSFLLPSACHTFTRKCPTFILKCRFRSLQRPSAALKFCSVYPTPIMLAHDDLKTLFSFSVSVSVCLFSSAMLKGSVCHSCIFGSQSRHTAVHVVSIR